MNIRPPRRRLTITLVLTISLVVGSTALSQTSSIAKRHAQQAKTNVTSGAGTRDPDARRGNPTLEKHSLVAVQVKPPKTFAPHDLITIIIREQVKFEADGELQTKKKFDIKSNLSAFFKPIDGVLGAATFGRGVPNIDFKIDNKLKNQADKDREDRLTTRITAEVIDVKPNGNLVLQARGMITFDNEVSVITLTGTVRNKDVTPDNTVLSTQLANKNISIQNTGAIRDGSRRGWIPRLLDAIGPF